jgi:ribosome maturation factor RimP
MAKRSVDSAQLRTVLTPLCDAEAVELVDARLTTYSDGAVLRVLIDVLNAEQIQPGQGGVTLDQCTRVSRAVSAWLDAHEDLIDGTFRLEVSSPGVERPLVLLHDFARFANREARITLRAPVGQRKKTVSGLLLGIRDDNVVVRDEQGEELLVPYSEISRAQLVFRF